MKLSNSIVALKTAFETLYYKDKEAFNTAVRDYWDKAINNPKIKNPNTALRWALWRLISKDKQDEIIAKSVGLNTYVGGYFQDVTDKHIDTLLNKVLNHAVLTKMITNAKLSKLPR